MSKPIKVLILLFALIASVFAVLVFAKTITKPPVDMHFSNPHQIALEKDIQSMNEAFPEEEQFDLIKSELEFQTKEHLLDESEHDKVADLLVSVYVPLFHSYSWSCFSSNSWSERNMAAIQNRCESLKSLSLMETGGRALDNNEELSRQFDSICEVVNDYYTAISIAKSTTFTTIDNARDVINRANSLKNKYPLKNYTSLVSQMDELPRMIEQSHYNYLVSSVNQLDCSNYEFYWSNTREDSIRYENHYNGLIVQINNYINNTSFYPSHHDGKSLSDSAMSLRSKTVYGKKYGEGYFDPRKRKNRIRY